MAIDNLHTIKGTLYSKEVRKVPNKKDPTKPDWEFYSIKVETTLIISGSKRTLIPELNLDMGVTYEEFEVGDSIEVDFYLIGKQVSELWYKTEAKVVYIKHSDIQTRPAKVKDNKLFTNSMSNIDTIGDAPVKDETKVKEDVFVPVRARDEDKEDDLPF